MAGTQVAVAAHTGMAAVVTSAVLPGRSTGFVARRFSPLVAPNPVRFG